MQDYLFESLGVAGPGRRCACSAATGAILSGSKIAWQRCDVRSRVVDQGPAYVSEKALRSRFVPDQTTPNRSTRLLRK
ncbi:hypothetical protein SNE510_51460 [Streptomyces sp. NE5-10]|nr:hypothetical protein SNE510_51460 [Streptomyces sp. NE5-10]